MLRVGLTGELGSGKSTVARLLAEHGAVILSSDEMGRALMQPGEPVYAQIVERFGAAVMLPNGELDRPALARLAFDPEHPRVEELNAIVHPAVIAEQERRLAALARTQPEALVVIESALLLTTRHAGGEVPWRRRFDLVVLVEVPEEQKIARFIERARRHGGADPSVADKDLREDALRRLAAQRIPAEAVQHCIVLHNDAGLDELALRTDALFTRLQAEAAVRTPASSPGRLEQAGVFGAEPSALERPEALLTVEDLQVRFGERAAVRGISFAVGAGETLGLVGESGSGKSVTSMAIMRLLGPGAEVTGSIRLHGAEVSAGVEDSVDLLALPEEGMRRQRGRSVAMVFQEPMTALNPVMPIGRQVGEAILAHAPRTGRREVRERVLDALRAVALPDPERRLRDFPHQFSGGQRQRIVIAMALINRPRLVIADEPTTALDVTVQAQILALLRQLRSEYGLSLLFISHDLAVVGQIADRIAVMRHGEIVECGPAHELLTHPRHPYTQGLLAAAPTLHTPRDAPLPTPGRARGPGTEGVN